MFGAFQNFKKLNQEIRLDFISKETNQQKKMMIHKTKHIKR